MRRKTTVIVDIGGTKTRVWVRDGDGPVLDQVTYPTLEPTVLKDLRKSLRILNVAPSQLIVGIRGVWTKNEKKSWEKRLRPFSGRIVVLSDVELAYRMFFGGQPGILLNAGTGSIAFGMSPQKKTARAGGFGPLLGDEGSGFWIGREYLKRVLLPEQGPERLRRFLTKEASVPRIAGLAKETLKLAKVQDATAAAIVRESHAALADLVGAVMQGLTWEGPALLKLTGGLFDDAAFHDGFVRLVESRRLNVRVAGRGSAAK